jgi:hypothetical protein
MEICRGVAVENYYSGTIPAVEKVKETEKSN